MNKKKSLLVLIAIIIVVFLIVIFSLTTKNNTVNNGKCVNDSFFSVSYSLTYYPNSALRYIFISSEEEYDNNADLLSEDVKSKLDFKRNDYLIYFMDEQYGCAPSEVLSCVKMTKKGLIMTFEKNNVDESCDAIFSYAYVISLEKGKYDKNIEVGVAK